MSDESVNGRSNGRMHDGTFTLGNKAARGNPVNRRMMELRRALVDSADPEKVKAIGAKLAELAEAGDVGAAKVWLEFMVGKPIQNLALSDADGEPLGGTWERFRT